MKLFDKLKEISTFISPQVKTKYHMLFVKRNELMRCSTRINKTKSWKRGIVLQRKWKFVVRSRLMTIPSGVIETWTTQNTIPFIFSSNVPFGNANGHRWMPHSKIYQLLEKLKYIVSRTKNEMTKKLYLIWITHKNQNFIVMHIRWQQHQHQHEHG